MHRDRLFLIISLFLVTTEAIGCYRCVSREESLSPIARTQIRNQIDTFFVPVEARSPGCSSSIDEDTPNVELQLCSVYPFCVTLTPNLPEAESQPYVVRGCFELTLRSHLREHLIAESTGCFLVRSFPGVPPNGTLDYIVCVCEGDYCNKDPIPAFHHIEFDLRRKSIQRLSMHNGSLQYVSSSNKNFPLTFSILMLFLKVLVKFY